jgi:SAM-dependent methyltransferase
MLMSANEPSTSEILTTRLLGNTLARPFYRRWADKLELSGNETALDFGSGSGVCTKHLARRLALGGRLTCVEISQRWIEVARRTLKDFPNVEYRVGKINSLCLPDSAYYVVFIHFVLHDIPEQERPGVVAELARVLKPGGKLFLREPVGRGAPDVEDIRKLMKSAHLRETQHGGGYHWFTGEVYEGVWTKDRQIA